MSDGSGVAVEFKVIELTMLKKDIFLPLSGVSSFTSHTILYPLVLVRTRLQLQQGSQVYTGLIDAARSIMREEGFKGLYNGYMTKCFQLISGVVYVTTYESVRSFTKSSDLSSSQRSFVAGATASTLAQTLLVPVDVISQHLMLQSRARNITSCSSAQDNARLHQIRALSPITLTEAELESPWKRFKSIVRYVAVNHGLRGFYQGYLTSLCIFVPSSGSWWFFYDKFCSFLAKKLHLAKQQKEDLPRLPIQLTAAPLAGITSAILINPLDCVRVRMQISNQTFRQALTQLWHNEGIKFATKGLSARLIQSSLFSFWLILLYEPIKMYSLKDEYKYLFQK